MELVKNIGQETAESCSETTEREYFGQRGSREQMRLLRERSFIGFGLEEEAESQPPEAEE
eukprot:460766-Amphidinium_carterae.1